jgi:predicted SAM-dependent methyltransferase
MLFRTLHRLRRRHHVGIIRDVLARAANKRIVIGAGGICPPDWIATEQYILNMCSPQDWAALMPPGFLAAILAEHVWEHLTPEDALTSARYCLQHLRPGGHLRVAVPDGLHPDPRYVEAVRPGGSGAGAEDHKVLYTHASFAEVFRQAGFEIRALEHYDEAGRFHFHEWDPRDGMIWRSLRYDERNRDGKPNFASIILDAVKPAAARS